MSKAMDKFLDCLIEKDPEHMPQMQIIFMPGTGANAGALRKAKDAPGMYELCTYIGVTAEAPSSARKNDLVAVSMFFESDAVQRVMVQTDTPNIEVVSPEIVPARS